MQQWRIRTRKRKTVYRLEPRQKRIIAFVFIDGLNQPGSIFEERLLEVIIGVGFEGFVQDVYFSTSLQWPDVLLENFPLVSCPFLWHKKLCLWILPSNLAIRHRCWCKAPTPSISERERESHVRFKFWKAESRLNLITSRWMLVLSALRAQSCYHVSLFFIFIFF